MSQQKLRELVLYVAGACENDPDFGMVKLNKVLFHADFSWFAKTGRPITGADYQKEEQGPVAHAMVPVLRNAEADRDLDIRKTPRGGYEQKRVVPRRKPRLELFTKEEIAAVDESIELLKGMSAAELSDYFHNYLGWQAAELHQRIPYETAYFVRRTPTQEELEYALTLEKVV